MPSCFAANDTLLPGLQQAGFDGLAIGTLPGLFQGSPRLLPDVIQPQLAGVISDCSHMTVARRIRLTSSRTFPGQWYCLMTCSA